MGKEEVFVCQGRWCREVGSIDVQKKLQKKDNHIVHTCRCLGHCERAVTLMTEDRSFVHDVTPENVFDKLNNKEEHRRYDQALDDDIDDLFSNDF